MGAERRRNVTPRHLGAETLHSARAGPLRQPRSFTSSFAALHVPTLLLPQTLILEDTVRNKKREKKVCLIRWKKKKMKTHLIWALLTALFSFSFFFIPYILPAMYPFDVRFTVVLIEGSSEIKMDWYSWEKDDHFHWGCPPYFCPFLSLWE